MVCGRGGGLWAGRGEPSVPALRAAFRRAAAGRSGPRAGCCGASRGNGPRCASAPCGGGSGANPSPCAPAFAPAASAQRYLARPPLVPQDGHPAERCPCVSLTHPLTHRTPCGGTGKVSKTRLNFRQMCEMTGLSRISVRGGCGGQQGRPRGQQGAWDRPESGRGRAPAWGPPAGRCRHLEGAGGGRGSAAFSNSVG